MSIASLIPMLNFDRWPQLRADDRLHRALDAKTIVGEVDDRARGRIGDEADTIGRAERVHEAGRRLQHAARGAGADVELIDGEHDHPAVRRRLVGGEDRLEGIGGLLARGLDVDLDELGRDDATRFAVDLHQEIGREQVLDRTAAAVGHGDVHGDDVDAGAERRSLFRRLRLLALVRLSATKPRRTTQ